MIDARRLWTSALVLAFSAAAAGAEIKVLLCPGDYGMWAQDRAKLIIEAVNKTAPGQAVFEVEQSYNFVQKLQAPGFAGRYDVIVVGDVALGQIPTKSQQELVDYVQNGGGLVWVVWGKTTAAFKGSRQVEPMPLESILPYDAAEGVDPLKNARADAVAYKTDSDFLKAFDFSSVSALSNDAAKSPLMLERKAGKGTVLALWGGFGVTYKYIRYATFEHVPGGWDEWPQLGQFWISVLGRAGAASAVKDRSLKDIDAAVKVVDLKVEVAVDATAEVDDIRSANFSVVSLSQLFLEDGGAGEELLKELNPKGWFDRAVTDPLFESKAGKLWPENKTTLFTQYGIQGILMGNNSYGSYAMWTPEQYDKARATLSSSDRNQLQYASYKDYSAWKMKEWQADVDRLIATARKYPQFCQYMQPGNEPPCDEGYYKFHNFMASAVIKATPDVKVIGPNAPFNLSAPDEKGMREFLAKCGANTDVLCWHIYGRSPESVVAQARYWSREAEGKLRGEGPVKVMFTEADTWNTRESQFNYLVDRAMMFLKTPEIFVTFQYCMRPRYEGGTYWFGVLTPPGDTKLAEFMANYNGYWIFRDLRGRMVESQVKVSVDRAKSNCQVIASSDDGGRKVTVICHYDTGYYSGTEKAAAATFNVSVKLPAGWYRLVRSDADWTDREVGEAGEPVQGTGIAGVTLKPSSAAALTWVRQ